MKKFVILAALVSLGWMGANAQVSVNINIGAPPRWAPAMHQNANYYYLPDIETYYYVPKRQFVYREGNRWVYRNSVPSKYRNYDLYKGYKVPIHGDKAYKNFEKDRRAYAKFRNYKGNQANIRSIDKRFDNKGNYYKGNNKNNNRKGGGDRGRH